LCEREGLIDLLPWARFQLAGSLVAPPVSDLPRAEALLRQALESREAFGPKQVQRMYGFLARVYAHQGKWDEVMAAMREICAAGGVPTIAVFSLNQMEETLDAQGRRAEFIAFCDDARRLLAQTGAVDSSLAQWYLAPAQASDRFSQVAFQDDFEGPALREEWQWSDPLQINAYSLAERAGRLTLHAAEGTDLGPNTNLTAPRLLLEVRGEFALEARMEGDWDARDGNGGGGLVVWKDNLNLLRLEKCGMGFHYESVLLQAIVRGEFRIVGRGLLRGSAFHLRLEREGERFTALCSADGVHWLTCGQVAFPARDPLRVGIASLQGMVAHFDWVRVLTKP
jgi:regulation of enolase protein 1 (concanavalin A-like superfamily)